jgi:acyl carrier protein
METTSARITSVISKSLALAEGEFTLESSLVDDLGISSLDRLELIMSLEEEFHREFDENALAGVKTVGDLITFIDS